MQTLQDASAKNRHPVGDSRNRKKRNENIQLTYTILKTNNDSQIYNMQISNIVGV
jgi:hypothetical protein